MSTNPPLALATSEDLRYLAAEARFRATQRESLGTSSAFHITRCRARADRVATLADALDQLHAVPLLRPALERMQGAAAKQREYLAQPHASPTPDQIANVDAVETVCAALLLLLPPGEPQEER